MSAPTTKKSNGKKPAPQRQEKPDMDPVELMKSMGGNGWFNPISNDMIRLVSHLAKTHALPRPMLVMQAWMLWHTLTSGNRQPYANRNGVMLFIRDMAEGCGIEIRNCRMYWSKGVELKMWRNGDAENGESAEGLYGRASVEAVECEFAASDDDPPEPSDSGYVHTLKEKFLSRFKPYIREKLEQLPPESFQRFAARWDHFEEIGDSAHADSLAAVRTVIGQVQDSLLGEVGIEKKRLDGTKHKSEEELAEAAARQARIEKLLLPHVQQYVQTLEACVPTPEPGLYTDKSASVHTSGNGASNSAAPAAIPAEKQPLTDTPISMPKRAPSFLDLGRDLRAPGQAGVSSSPTVASGASTFQDGEKSVQLPARERQSPSGLKPEERERAEKLLNTFAQIRTKYPHSFAGEPFNPNDKGQLATAAKIVRTVGLEELEEFGIHIETKAAGRSLGHQLTMGLLSEIATEFRAGRADRERERQAAAARLEQQQAYVRAMKERNAREDVLIERAEKEWAALPLDEQVERLRVAGQELKSSPHYQSVFRHDAEKYAQAKEQRAKLTLRREIEKREDGAK